MAKNRYINTRFWSDNFISELNPLDRYLFLYFLTNEHTNICGIYEIPLRTISFETGIEIDMLKKMIKRLEGKIYYVEGWIYIKNFAKHQAINEKVEKGIENAKKLVPKKIWLKIKELDSLSIGDDRVSIGYQLPEPESEPEPELESELEYKPNTSDKSQGKKSKFSQEGSDVIKAFEEVDPKNKTYYSNITQRKAADFLISEYGIESVLKVIKILPKSNQTDFCPVITSPHDLKEKWQKLAPAIQKIKNKQPILI